MEKLLRFTSCTNLLLGVLVAANFFALPLQAQEAGIPDKRNCSSMEVLANQLAQQPGQAQAMHAIEVQTARFIKQADHMRSSVIKIPVVVHVVYNNSTQNISHAQIKSQIDVLNRDFRRTNTDADNTWSQAADIEIEFALATVDPNGRATSGITRTPTSVTSFGNNDAVKRSSSGGKDAWPAGSYMNLWVCNLSGNTLGFAQFPGGNAQTDGIVIGHKFFGTTGTATAPFNLGRTTTHEVGHWLNLRHIWGDGDCSVDDYVADTPASDAPNYNCEVGKVSCNTVNMVQNYMDYSDDACMNLFTAGQKTRMRALFASNGARASLLNSGGFGGGTTEPAPTCTANTVNLKLVFDNYPAETSWQLKNSSGSVVASGGNYTSPGATINESFCLPSGCYDFVITDAYGDGICCTYGNGSYSLTDASGATLASGSNFGQAETKNICVGDTGTSPASCPAIDFSSYSITGFADQDAGNHQVQDAGTTLYLNGNTWKQIPYNYTVTANTVLEFEYRSTQMGDIQGIAFENDNGITPGYSFRVYGNQSWGIANYRDYSGTSWKKYTIPVGNFFTGNFNKLVFVGDDDLYDRQTSYFRNVKVYEGSCGGTRLADLRTSEKPVVGHEADQGFGISLYPNPASNNLHLALTGEAVAQTVMYNATGKQVWTSTLKHNQPVTIDVSALPAGIYTLRTTGEKGNTAHYKFIKQ